MAKRKTQQRDPLRSWEATIESRVIQLLDSRVAGRLRRADFCRWLPELSRQILADRQSPCLEYWGSSFNVDENVGQKIVAPTILTMIGQLAGYSIRNGRSYHAGLLHTYGYCLSLIETPYGKKRRRWVEQSVSDCLGLESGLLTPAPVCGTLLGNLTVALRWLLADSGFRDPALDGLALMEWQSADPRKKASDSLHRCNPSALKPKGIRKVHRIRETVRIERRRVDLCTLLAKGKSKNYLCVYWLDDHRQPGSQLLTTFPMDTLAAEQLLMQASGRQPIRLRFNAHVHGWQRYLTVDGQREIS